jgi:hypothetical protein
MSDRLLDNFLNNMLGGIAAGISQIFPNSDRPHHGVACRIGKF